MEPSRDTAGRRRRELLAHARLLDEIPEVGPDQSVVVYRYGGAWDGWTVRRLDRLADQWREGALMSHCLREAQTADPNAWSLRDPDGLPHLTFATWRVEPSDNLDEIPFEEVVESIQFVHVDQALFLVDVSTRPLKPERREQLADFAHNGDRTQWRRFPQNSGQRMREVLPNFNFTGPERILAQRVVDNYARRHAAPPPPAIPRAGPAVR
jgi:hypothetical protein